jgi:hypothetical protein
MLAMLETNGPPTSIRGLSAWWPLLFVAVFLLGSVTTCRDAATKAVHNAALWDDAQGHPLDHAGDGLKCQNCGGALCWQRGYAYSCQSCATTVQARYHSETGWIEFFR